MQHPKKRKRLTSDYFKMLIIECAHNCCTGEMLQMCYGTIYEGGSLRIGAANIVQQSTELVLPCHIAAQIYFKCNKIFFVPQLEDLKFFSIRCSSFFQYEGEYILIRHTLGSVPAFALIWLSILITTPCADAIGQLTFASYVLGPFFPGCADREDLVPLLKIIGACSLCKLLGVYMSQSYLHRSIRVSLYYSHSTESDTGICSYSLDHNLPFSER